MSVLTRRQPEQQLPPDFLPVFRTVEPHFPKSVRFLACTFGEWKGGQVIKKGTMFKMAQGQMVR